MSLLRLLTSGKSLVGFKGLEGQYRMRTGHLLPKFGSPKNPFLSQRPPALETAADAGVPSPAAERLPQTPAESAAAALKKTTPLPAAPPAGLPSAELKRPSGPSRAASLLQRLRGMIRTWKSKFGRSHTPASKPRAASTGTAAHSPTQGELSLDKIKVIRNDLNDADVEIVSAASAVKPKPTPAGPPEAKSELAAIQAR